MELHFTSSGYIDPETIDFEVVERKGIGHPDSLADGAAEAVSAAYSRFTIKSAGHVLHHNIDKLSILGGESRVRFGDGELIKPIRIVLNGRFTDRYQNLDIPVLSIAHEAISKYIHSILPLLNIDHDMVFLDQTSVAASPGKGPSFFRPSKDSDLPELLSLKSNDTVTCVSFFPYSRLEQTVLDIETFLNSTTFKNEYPIFGSDIKVLAARWKKRVHFTLCVPLIARDTRNLSDYICAKNKLFEIIQKKLLLSLPEYDVVVSLNTKDDYDKSLLYLTAIGSAIESGDEGQVGRGNRVGGLISVMRGSSVEAACGKNPIYHSGKLYAVLARRIAERIYVETGLSNQVYLISQNGSNLNDPLFAVIQSKPVGTVERNAVNNIINEELHQLTTLSNSIIQGNYNLF